MKKRKGCMTLLGKMCVFFQSQWKLCSTYN
jgi:hypothetical protein